MEKLLSCDKFFKNGCVCAQVKQNEGIFFFSTLRSHGKNIYSYTYDDCVYQTKYKKKTNVDHFMLPIKLYILKINENVFWKRTHENYVINESNFSIN